MRTVRPLDRDAQPLAGGDVGAAEDLEHAVEQRVVGRARGLVGGQALVTGLGLARHPLVGWS